MKRWIIALAVLFILGVAAFLLRPEPAEPPAAEGGYGHRTRGDEGSMGPPPTTGPGRASSPSDD